MPKIEKIIRIGSSGQLFSVRYKGGDYLDECDNELRRSLRNWCDPHFMRTYYQQHRSEFLHNKTGAVDEWEATLLTCLNAKIIKQDLVRAADNTNGAELRRLFKPLAAASKSGLFHQKKIKRPYFNAWPRLYAVSIPGDFYIISGGALKLTFLMDEHVHLKEEMAKNKNLQKRLQSAVRSIRADVEETGRKYSSEIASAIFTRLEPALGEDFNWRKFCQTNRHPPAYSIAVKLRIHMRQGAISEVELAQAAGLQSEYLTQLLAGNQPIPNKVTRSLEKATGLKLLHLRTGGGVELSSRTNGIAF